MAASEDSGRRRSSRRRKGKHKHASQMEIDLSDIQLPPESIPLPPEPIPPPPPPLPPPSQPPPLPTGLANNGEMEAPPPPPPPPPPKDEHHSGREPILMKIKKISPTPMSKDGSGEHRGDKTKPGSPGKIRFQIKPVVRRVSYGDDTTSSEHGTGHSEVKQPIRFKMKRRDGKFQAEDLSRIVHEEMDHQVSESETTKDSSNVISEVNTGVTPLSSSTSVNKKEIRLPIIGRITRSRADDRSKSETGKSKVTFSVQNMIRQKMKALSHGNRDLPEPQVVLDKLDPSDLETVKLYDQLTQEKMAHNAPATSTKLPGVETLTSTDIGMSGPDVIPKVETRLPGPIPALVQPDSPSVPELHGQKQEKIQIGDKPDRVETIERKHEPGLPPKTIITRTVVVDHSQRSLGNKPRLRRSRFDVVSSDHNRTSETSDAGTKTHKDKPLSISQDSTHTGETETNRSKRSHRESPSRIEIDLPIPSFGIQALETDLHKTKKPEQSCKDSSSDNLRHIVKEKFVPIGKDVSSIQPPAPLAIPVPPPVTEQTKVDMFDVPLPVCDPTTATIPLPRDSHQDTAHKVEEPVTDNAIEIAEPSTPVLDEPRDVTDISFTVPITESSISDAPFENKEIPVVKLVNYEAADDVVREQEPVDMDIDDSNEAKEANIEETKVIDEEAETAVNSILEQNYEKCEENYEETQKLDFAWDSKKQGHENLSQSECQEEQVPVEKKGWCENTEAKEVWQTESQDEWSQSWGETASKKEPVDMKEGPADDEGVESDLWSASQQWLQDVQVSERAEWTPLSRQPNSEHSESVKPEVLANTAHRTDSDESLGVKLCPEIVQPEEQISMIPIPISEEAGESNWKSLAQNASVASEEASTMPEPCAGSREESQNMQVSQNHEHDQMDVPVGAIPMPNDDHDDKETNITKSFSQNTMLNMEANVIHTLDSDDKGESQWIKSASQIVEPDMPATMIPGPTDDDTKEVQTMKLHSPSLTSGLLSDRFSQPIGENSETLQEIEPFCGSIKPDIQADNVTESLSDSVSDSEESENLKYFHQSSKTELAVPAVKMSRSISSDSSESEESQNVKSSTDNITDQNTDTLNTGLFDDTPIVMEPSDPSDIDGTVKSDDEDVRARMELEYLNFEQAIGLEPARENKLEEIEGTLPNQEYDGGPTCQSREMVEQEENEHKQTESELDINESNDAQVEDEKNETEEPWSSTESGVDGTTHDEGSLQGVPADQEESSQYEGRLLVGQSPTRQTEEQRSEKLVNYPVSEESRLSPSDNSQDETPDLSPQQFPEPELEQEEESAKDLQANEVFHHDLSTDITTEQNKQESQSQSCEDVYEARLSSHKAESDLVSHEDSERFNVELQHAKDQEEAYSPSSAMDIEEDESTDKDIPASVSGPETEPMQGGQHPDPESSLEEDDNRGMSSKDQAECWGGGQESEGVGNRAEGPGLDSAPEVSADSYDIPKDDHATNVQGSEQLDSQEFKGADEAPKSVDEYIEQGAPEHLPDDTTAVYTETDSPVRDIDTGQETGVVPEIPGELHEKQSEMDLELSSSRDSSEAGKPDSGSDTRADDSCGSGKGRKRRPSRRSLQGLGLDQADTESADAESECASTRRRSRRIKSIEERREREKEEKETKGRGEKVRGNKEERQLRHQEDRERRDREERERKRQEEKDKREADRKTRRERQEKLRQEKGQIKIKLETTSIFHEDAKASEIPVDVTSIPVPDSPIPTSTSAVGGSLLSPSSASENKDLLRRPEIDALRREDFGSPKHEKVKSRWRRWSEAEAVAGQAGQAGLSPVQSSSASTSPVVAKPEPSYPIKQELLFAPPPPPPPPPPPLPPAPVVVSESVATAPLETTAKPEVDPQLVSPKVDSKPLAAIEEAPNEESPSMEIDYHEFISKMEEEMGAETSVLVENESLESEGILPTEPEALPPEMPKAKEPEVEEGETAPDESTPYFEKISDNIYLSERKKSKAKKEVKRMLCDCTTSREDRAMGIPACGEDCLNRLLMIECGSRCPCADYCTNRRFQRHDYCKTETFKTSHKGWGLQAKENLERDTFVMEYVGEVLDFDKFKARTEEYDRHNQTHYYFMALNSDEIIDATKRGNESRFINHSCNPNCETQKWTVNGELRIGFFTKRDIKKEEELTFDYQFESYGESQKCYCGSSNCRGVLGGEKTTLFRYGATASTTTSTKAPATPVRANKKKPKKENFDDRHLQDDIDKMTQLDGMRNRRHVLELARLMVRAESSEHRTALLKIMQVTSEQACLRLFLDYHGLSLMWSWMADIGEGSLDLKMQILKTLKSLPINNKTILQDSKVMNVVQKWAKQIAEAAEKDTETETASDTPSQSGTPLRSETPSQVETPTCSETPSQSDTPTVAGPEGPSVKNLEITSDAFQKMPHKKRRLLQHALEDSSSDSELSESSRLSMIPGIVPLEPVQNVASDNSMQGMAVDPELPSNKKSDTDSEIGALSVSEISLPPSDSIKAELKDEGMELEPGEIADTELEEGEIKEKSALKAEILSESSRDGTETPAPETPKPVEDNKSQKIADMASQLLDTWKDLKEMFKIPKRVVEERKRTERELDRRYRERDHRDRDYDRHRERGRSHDRHYDRDYDRYRDRDRERDRERERDRDRDRERDRNRDRDRYDRKRHREESPERRDRHDRRSEKKHRRSEDRDDDSRDKKDKDGKKEKEDEGPLKTRKVLLPTPPKISKHERRKLFEAEVKAKEEMEELQKAYMLQQQLQQSTDPAYQFYQDPNMAQFGDPSGAQFVDPNSAQFVDPNAAQFVDPNAAQFVDPNSAFADPNAQFTDPNAVQYADPNVPAYTDPVATPYLDSAGGQFAEPTGQYGEPMTPAPLLPDHTPGQVAAQQMVMNADGTMTAATPANKIPSLLSVDPSQPPQTVVSAPAQTPIIPQQQQQFVETSAPPVVYQTQQGFQVQQSFVQAQPQTVAAPTAPPRQPLQNYMPGTTTQIVQNVQGQLQTVQRIPVVQGQQVYYTTPQGVVVQQQTYPQGAVQQGAVTQASVATPSPQVIQVMKPSQTLSPGQLAQVQQLQQQLQIQQQQLAQLAPAAAHDDPPPPPSPPKSKSQKLPPNWKTARDAEGKTYYYHSVTRQTQWDPPTWDSGDQDDMDLGTPTHDEPSSKKKKTLTAAADTSSELAKRMKDQFKYNMSQFMKICLNPYRKPDCKIGRITSTEDFKHLARKLTHTILDKELKQCRHHLEDLEVNENVKAKAKDYVKKYMSRFGSTYKKVQSP